MRRVIALFLLAGCGDVQMTSGVDSGADSGNHRGDSSVQVDGGSDAIAERAPDATSETGGTMDAESYSMSRGGWGGRIYDADGGVAQLVTMDILSTAGSGAWSLSGQCQVMSERPHTGAISGNELGRTVSINCPFSDGGHISISATIDDTPGRPLRMAGTVTGMFSGAFEATHR